MKPFRYLLAALFVVVAASAGAQSLSASDAFKSAPMKVIPLLDANTRLDMIDYFNSGSSTPSTNALGGKSRITDLTPASITVALTDASSYQLAVLPGDVIALISTVLTPAPDSKMTLYSSDWQRNLTPRLFAHPALADWLTPEGRAHADEVEALVPFLLISYTYDPSTQTLTLTNNTHQFVAQEIYETIAPWLQKTKTYTWDRKKFTPAES